MARANMCCPSSHTPARIVATNDSGINADGGIVDETKKPGFLMGGSYTAHAVVLIDAFWVHL